jgi:transposase
MVTRDRSETFAKAITRGAPTAVQVADRWHLMHNWSAVVERVLTHDAKAIRTLMMPIAVSPARPAATLLPAKTVHRRRNYADERRAEVRAQREDLYQRIQIRSGNGEYLTTIARDLGLNYKTVRKYARAAQCPHMKAYPERTRMLDIYLPYLTARWAEGCHNGKRLHREIVAHGFQGSRVLVAVWAAQRRREDGAGVIQPNTAERPLTVRDATWIMLSRADKRTAAIQALSETIWTLTPRIAALVGLSDRFTTLLRERQQERLADWITDARSSDIKEVRHFAVQLTRDEAAVRAACTVEWSNGQTEGQVNRLKFLKRAMYGRAKFDLLRQRVLYRG